MKMEASSDRIPMTRHEKLATSSVIWFCTFTLGLGVSFLGSSLLELSNKFQTDVSSISKVFTILTFSFLVGAITCGVIFNYVNRQVVSAILLILMGIGTILFPIVPSLPLFFGVASLVGFTAAGYDTAQIVWIIEMWENNAAVYIQVQHFSFAVGTFISPLLIGPFLSIDVVQATEQQFILQSNVSGEEYGIDNTTLLYYSTIGQDDVAQLHSTFDPNKPVVSPTLYIPFLIGGLTSIFGAFLILAMYWYKKYEKPIRNVDLDKNTDGKPAKGALAKSCNSKKFLLVLLSALVLGGYQGMEMCSFQFLPTFTHFIDLHLSQPNGAMVLSGLTGAFTVGRGIGICIVFKILPEVLLLGNITLIIVGNSLLLYFANTSLPILLIGSVSLGIGFSTVFPSFYGYIEKHLKVSNVVGATMIVAGSLVSSMYPIIIGTFIQKNPFVLIYTNFFSLTVCTTAFVIIFCITKGNAPRRRVYKLGQEEKPNYNSDEEANADAALKSF